MKVNRLRRFVKGMTERGMSTESWNVLNLPSVDGTMQISRNRTQPDHRHMNLLDNGCICDIMCTEFPQAEVDKNVFEVQHGTKPVDKLGRSVY